ncbi:MAG: hypothetical protein WBA29_17845 [Xanthobacteraceae bacterium]
MAAVVLCGALPPSYGGEARPLAPFTKTLSNHLPLAFGMTPAEAADALGTPLAYVSGRRGNEVYRAARAVNGSLFFPRRDDLYLQFRRSRLTGWKGDWNLAENWR